MAAPKLPSVTLRCGTKFLFSYPDGTISAEHTLTEDTEVEVVELGNDFNVYDFLTLTILVATKDEVR